MEVPPTSGQPRRVKLAVAAGAVLYVLGLAWSAGRAHAFIMAPVVVAIAVVALARWGRRAEARGLTAAHALVPLLALYAVPFARLLVWNGTSPLPEALFDLARPVERAFSGGWNPRHLPPLLEGAVLVVRLVPFALLALLWALLPLGVAALLVRGGRALAPRLPRALLAALGLGAVVAAVVLLPVACDTHESWIEVPDARCSCAGLTVDDYPPGVADGERVQWCIGFERPPAGVG